MLPLIHRCTGLWRTPSETLSQLFGPGAYGILANPVVTSAADGSHELGSSPKSRRSPASPSVSSHTRILKDPALSAKGPSGTRLFCAASPSPPMNSGVKGLLAPVV